MSLSAQRIHELARELAPHIRRTPLVGAPAGGFLKLESLQPAGSFKVRGFFAAALALDPEQRKRGLITVSAGNAALACAHVARHLGVSCRVVMYDSAPKVKSDGVRERGAQVLPMPRDALYEWVSNRGWEREPEVFIHPFADEMVMAGHATVVPEILADCPQVTRVIVPVGGGGLISGIADGLTALAPHVRVIGVQSDGYPLWPRAFEVGGPVPLTPHTICDGTTAPFHAGMFERLRTRVHDWVVIPEADVHDAVRRLVTDAKLVVEGSGALAYAALAHGHADDTTVAVISGGNIDPSQLTQILSAA